MGTQFESYADPIAFRAAVDGYLRANLAECNHIFSLAQGLTAESIRRNQSWLARLHRDGATCGVGLIHSAPPRRQLLVTNLDDECAAAMARGLNETGGEVDAMVGPRESVAALAKLLDVGASERLCMGNHMLSAPPCIAACAGDVRAATTADFELLLRWETEFLTECRLPLTASNLARELAERLSEPAILYWLWCVGNLPVAMALGRARPPVARVGMVYTAPAHRGRGYAGALVGNVSEKLFRQGCEAVFLFTDLANPTSNGVYQRIGFRRIGEVAHVDLARGIGADGKQRIARAS
ncbi:MAG TPA: hypothetical protein DIT28_02000 [Oxalobacteraceae bacterium]|nr:hypothetical protein [Oxalobacteraceae bacterium]HCN87938.1 hypothetical protein [Oxalobacteraceae bacterium]